MSPTACGAVLLGSPPRCLFSSSFLEKWQTNRPPATAICHGKMVLLITLLLVKECGFFCPCPVYQHKENPFFCRWIPPPSAQLSLCAEQARCIHVFLSLLPISVLWVLLVWKSSPLCPSLLPKHLRAGLPSRSPAVSRLFMLCWDWSEHCLLPSATSTLPRSLTFRFKDDQTVFLWCLFCKHTHLHYTSRMPLHFLLLFLHFPVPAYLFFYGIFTSFQLLI